MDPYIPITGPQRLTYKTVKCKQPIDYDCKLSIIQYLLSWHLSCVVALLCGWIS